MAGDEAPISSSDLEIFSISEDLVPSTLPTPSQNITLDFNGRLNPPLILQTDETQCGGKLWPAGMVLAGYLLEHKMRDLKGKTMFVVRSLVYFGNLRQSPLSCKLGAMTLTWV